MCRIIGDIFCTDGVLRTVYEHEDGGQYVVDDGQLVLGHWLELPEEPEPPEPCDRPVIVYESETPPS